MIFKQIAKRHKLWLTPHSLWTVPTSLPRSQPSLVLLPTQDKTEAEFFMQRLRIPYTGYDSPPPRLSRIWASPARHLWHYFFHFWPWSRPWGVARLLCLRGVPPRPHPSEGVSQHHHHHVNYGANTYSCCACVDFHHRTLATNCSNFTVDASSNVAPTSHATRHIASRPRWPRREVWASLK